MINGKGGNTCSGEVITGGITIAVKGAGAEGPYRLLPRGQKEGVMWCSDDYGSTREGSCHAATVVCNNKLCSSIITAVGGPGGGVQNERVRYS